MANTQVFTLGVTAIPSLGSALDALRRQVDGIRLGRLIGEVIRLGLELDKVRLVERQLTTEQAWAHEDQIDRLRREGDEVERLRRRYLSLGRKPIEMRLLGLVSITTHGSQGSLAGQNELKPESSEKGGSQTDKSKKRSSQVESQETKAAYSGQQASTAVLLGSIGTVVGGAVAYGAYRKLPADARKSVREAADEGAPTAIGKVLVALGEEKGEDRAKGVGAAAGELVGGVVGTLLGALTKNERAKKYGGKVGELVGESLGGDIATWLYKTVYAEPDAKGKSDAASGSVDSAAGSSNSQPITADQLPTPAEGQMQGQEQSDTPGSASGVGAGSAETTSVALGATSLNHSIGMAASSSAGASLTRRFMRRIPVAAALDAGMQLSDIAQSNATPEQKREGFGTVIGGFGGGLAGAAAGATAGALVGSVVPVVGTAIGGLIGGVLGGMGGESLGGMLGKVLATGVNEVIKPAPSEAPISAVMPAPPAPSADAPLAVNQQFTFTANMPVTFNNSLDDPSVIQQLEQIARRTLTDLMERAKSAQLTDPVYV